MNHALARWGVLLGGLAATGTIAWSAIAFIRSPRGVPGPGIVDAISPVTASLALLVAFALCTLVAVVVSRLLNPVVALFTLGAGMGVAAMQSGTIRDACFDGGSLVPLGIEGIVWALLVAGASIVIHLATRHEALEPAGARGGAGGGGAAAVSAGSPGHASMRAQIFDFEALKLGAIGAVAIIGVWLLVTNPLKGQAIGAAVVGGLLAGHVAKRAAPHASPALLFASPILFIAIVQAIAATWVGDSASAFVRGSIPNLVAVMPLDLVSGSIVGVALGIGLAAPSK